MAEPLRRAGLPCSNTMQLMGDSMSSANTGEEDYARAGLARETFQTILADLGPDHVLTVTLNRPERLNAFNQPMLDDFRTIWRFAREIDFVHAIVLIAEGDRAFCSGVDIKDGFDIPRNTWSEEDPGVYLGPKHNRLWKPVVCAVHGITAGGAFYWINESDIVICAEDTTFFDPHVSYGLTAALEPIGLARRVPLGEALRIALMGLDERVSASRALQIGLVSEVVSVDHLRSRAGEIAALIARKPPAAIQGTLRAIWESLDETRSQALARGLSYTQLGNPLGTSGDRSQDGGPPHTVHPLSAFISNDVPPLTFAGLYETWWDKSRSKEPDPETMLRTCTCTCTSADFDAWLDPDQHDTDVLSNLLLPAPKGTLVRHPVDKTVNSPRNDGPMIIQPASADDDE